MNRTIPALAAVAALWIGPAWGNAAPDPASEILALERQALDGWLKGNPDPQLAIADPQITWFHVVTDKRVEGIAALREIFERYRGVPLFDSYEILNPKVQAVAEVAVLTYQLAQRKGAGTSYWNATQVYRRKEGGWRLIHTHWSAVNSQRP